MENRRSQTTTQTTQANNDVTTWALPEGATGRLGRGIPFLVYIFPLENFQFLLNFFQFYKSFQFYKL